MSRFQIDIIEISENIPETITISCHSSDEQVEDIVSFVKAKTNNITGFRDRKQYIIPVSSIHYFESVDDHTFAYCTDAVYEIHQRLYQLEESLSNMHFFRISKSTLLNIMEVVSISPGGNGRYLAVLTSGEKVVISRNYVKAFRRKLKGALYEYE